MATLDQNGRVIDANPIWTSSSVHAQDEELPEVFATARRVVVDWRGLLVVAGFALAAWVLTGQQKPRRRRRR